MTEEFDEEVVFENSPLFQYLQDLGHTDFEACPPLSQEEEPCVTGEEGHLSLQDVPALTREGLFWRLAEAIRRLNPFHSRVMSSSLEQQLDVAFRQYSLHTVLEQDVLLQEDVELIELLDPSILSTGSSSSPACGPTATPPTPRFLTVLSLWDVSVLVGFIAVLVGLRGLEDGPSATTLVPLVLLLVGVVLLRGWSLWRTARLQRAMWDHRAELEQLVFSSRALTSLARKSLRLIQETEVISRGFTLLLDRVSAACPFNKAGQPRGQQLLGLRKASFKALRGAFRAARLATCHMLKSYPLNSEIDNVTNYVSTVPLKELGLGLGEEPLSEERAQELTDDYSLPALKVLFQLWVGQSSEFFRRLLLLLSPGQEEQRGLADQEIQGKRTEGREKLCLMHRVVAEVTQPLHRTLPYCLNDLQRSYDFHRYFETQLQSHGSDRIGRARQKCRELNTLHASVRSLQLHLKALLNELIILEDELEKLMVSRETVEMTCAGYQELQGRLRLLQPHMQASSSCWEETVAQVERMLQRATNCPGTPDTPEERTPALPTPAPRPVTLIQDQDPIPEEQELEAYASDSDSDGEWQSSFLDLMTPEEREQQRREREESRRVLQELKSVLGLRASEAERQRWKQLLFSDQAALKPLLPEEPPEAHRVQETPETPPESKCTESNHLENCPQAAKGDGGDPRPSPTETEVEEEFSCGQSEGAGGVTCTNVLNTTEGTVHYQYDGTEEEGGGTGESGTWCPLVGRPPTLSVMDRLTEIHGSAALSFSSTLAAQVAARSHSFTNMEEQTFGDEEVEEEEQVTSRCLVHKRGQED
ncbi:vezatin isoform X1 [Scleropages formosus]|uniref:vezatin isoform X1 n=1 Tax=Scleropages formosus TaxID=113540 RepID=UPI0010FA838A|nr:vezatin isoform X1 [Scleropages formosus]